MTQDLAHAGSQQRRGSRERGQGDELFPDHDVDAISGFCVERAGSITGGTESGHDWVAVGCIGHNQVQASWTADDTGTVNRG
jgi:hypothetical protein